MKPTDSIKSFLPILMMIVIFAAVIFLLIIPYFKEQLLEQKKKTVKELTVNVISILNHFNTQVEEGLIFSDKAKKLAIDEIRALRYGKELKDYYWITDTFPKMIMHPYRTDLEGTDLSDYQDPDGTKLFVDALDTVKQNGAGYIHYLWQWKDDKTRIVPKISYVKLYPKWGWIIGSGLYVDDVENEINKVNKKLLTYSLLVFAIAFILALYVSYRGYIINKEKIQVQEELINSQIKYKEIVENASTIILKLDLNGNVVFFNEYAQALFGFQPNEILGKNAVGTIFPENEDGKFTNEKVKYLIKNFENYKKVENWNLTKDGEKKFIVWNNKPILTKNGELEGILSIGNDITERKILLDQLAENERKIKLIFNSVTDGILIFTESGKIIEANDTACRRSGFSREEYLQLTMQAILDSHPVLTFENLVEELGHKDFVSLEISYLSKSGQPVNIEVFARKFEYQGQQTYLAVTREISERIELQHKIYNAVIEAEEKERSRIAKELHDGVSPLLSTIKLFSQSIRDCKSAELQKEILEKIEVTINESIQSLSDISNNLSPHVLQNFGLIPALENFIEKIADTKDLNFHFEANVKSELGNLLDVTIYRIITELINNTIKYANAGNVFINLTEKDIVYLKYDDDGDGFDYKSVIENKKGMGLFNITNRVKSLKGYAKFSPQVGKGCKVEIELPKQ